MHQQGWYTQLVSQVDGLADKSKQSNGKVSDGIDILINSIEQAEQAVNNGKNHHQTVQKMLNKLAQKKPFNMIKNQFKHFYKRISNILKSIDESKITRPQTRLSQCLNGQKEWQILQNLLCEHFLRKGQQETGSIFQSQYQNKAMFLQCNEIKQQILQGNFQEAIKWTEMQKLYQTYSELLEYKLKKHYILELVHSMKFQLALQYYSTFMPKFIQEKEEQINQLIGYILISAEQYWKQALEGNQNQSFRELITSRYTYFSAENNSKGSLSDEFVNIYMKHYNISKFDSVFLCYKLGCEHGPNFMKSLQMLPDDAIHQSQLPFSIGISPDHQYHSTFLCPISKQVYSSQEGAVILDCGHLLSNQASTKLIQSRGHKKIRCPVCQKQQKSETMKTIKF